ncbi:UNVERIFIED_CONTAM: hypothetical protein FKN15_047247 [Acipenser sinensis]
MSCGLVLFEKRVPPRYSLGVSESTLQHLCPAMITVYCIRRKRRDRERLCDSAAVSGTPR